MSKSTDVTLNIRARNLAGKTLDEINSQVEQLAKNNNAQATSAEKAARSMRDLNDTSRQLAGAYNELARREGLTRQFVDQQKQIKATSERLTQLTADYRKLGKGVDTSANRQSMLALEQEIIDTNAAMTRLVRDNDKAGAALRKIGVDASRAEQGLTEIRAAVVRAGDAYKASEAEIEGYSAAQKRAADVAVQAAKRQAQANDLLDRANAPVRAIVGRSNTLAVLRADIEARSKAARAAETQAEAERRLAAEQRAGAEAQARATARVNEAVAASNRRNVLRAQITAKARDEANAERLVTESLSRSEVFRRRLVALLNTEIGRRGAAVVAARNEKVALDQNTGATTRNAAAKKQSATNLALFSDVGRKSLGTYQRLRGQILGLTAAYVGFYQVINTAQKAIQATNRNASLMVGLRTVNDGSAAAAASDYAFLRKEADRLGLVFDTLAPQYANVAIAGKALGLNTTQMRDMFSDTATAAAAMNLSVEDTEGVFRAMTQIFSKGKVQAEELRGQLGDRLPGAVVKFAQANNIALSDLDKMLEKGTIGVDFLIKGIQGYASQYDKELGTITTRLQAYINRATNSYNDFLRSLLTGANDQKLKDAFARIEAFFQGSQGQKFAESLATAFGKAIDVFIALADNVDLVVEAVKIFIGLQLLKFLNDTLIGVVALYGHFAKLTKFVWGYNAAAKAAALTTGTLSGRVKALAFALGPIAGVLAGIAGAFALYIKGVNEATERTKDYSDALHGLTFAKTAEEIEAAAGPAREEIKRLREDLEELEGLKSGGVIKRTFSFDRTDVARTDKALDEEIAKTRARLNLLTNETIHSELELAALRDEEAAKAAKERGAPLPTLTGDGDKGKGDGAKKAMQEANARLTARRALQKELLDLDQAVFDARSDGEVRTAAQVQKAYQLAVDKITSETEERYLSLQQKAQAMFTALGIATPGPASEEQRQLLGAARADYEAMVLAAQSLGMAEAGALQALGERVELLRTSRNDQAMSKSETQDIEVLERRINDLVDQRAAKIAHINALKEAGLLSEVDAYNQINSTQDAYTQRIREQIAEIMPLLQAIAANNEDPRQSWAKALIADFDILLIRQRQYTVAQRVIMNLGAQFASGAASAFVQLGKGIAGAIAGANGLGDAFKGAMDAFRTFAADFLQQIAEMILQAIILQAIKNAMGMGGGTTYWQAAMGALSGSNHTGGIVGGAGSGPKRRVHAGVFAGAQRFHTGGLPGLRSGEVATILKRGEEVLPESSPRHIGNTGGQGEGVTQVIATFDPSDVVIRALGDTNVKKRLFAVFNQNKNQINRSIGR